MDESLEDPRQVDLANLVKIIRSGGWTLPEVLAALDQVLMGTAEHGLILESEEAPVFMKIGREVTRFGASSGDCHEATSKELWSSLAEHLRVPDTERASAPSRWREAEARREELAIRHFADSLPDTALDEHWATRELRAFCLAHSSDRCDLCPPPTGFRRSYGIWVAPHPRWPDPSRGSR